VKNETNGISFRDLEAKLLSIGGTEVYAQPEPHLESLLERGRTFKPDGRRMVTGPLHRCHMNAALYYASHYALDFGGPCELVTGYGLYEEGGWAQHSWLWDGTRVLETNTKPTLYFGVILTPMEAQCFIFANVMVKLPGVEQALGQVQSLLA
jgi:hypothetical protein